MNNSYRIVFDGFGFRVDMRYPDSDYWYQEGVYPRFEEALRHIYDRTNGTPVVVAIANPANR